MSQKLAVVVCGYVGGIKICARCKTSQAIVDFHKKKQNKDGCSSYCKKCTAELQSEYYEKNSEKIKAYTRKWREANPDRATATSAAHYQKTKVQRNQNSNENYRLNKSAHQARCKAARLRNPQLYKSTAANYYIKNKTKINLTNRAWRSSNVEKANLLKQRWVEKHKDHCRLYSQNRRRLRVANGGFLSKDIIQRLFKNQNGRCPCCGQKLGKNYHLDHVIPLALGGRHSDENVQLMKSSCNLSKGKKHPIDYMQSKGFLL